MYSKNDVTDILNYLFDSLGIIGQFTPMHF